MSAVFNLGSFVFGIMSWIIPIVAISQCKKGYKSVNFSFYSCTFCAIALVLQLFEVRNRVNIGDFNALMDTIGAVAVVAALLVVITFMLNLIANRLCRKMNQ